MAMQPYTGASSSSVASLKKFDVFISFRGEDTRRKFTSHLNDALSMKVVTFIDENEVEKGDEISSTLIKAIEEAYVSVVIFSKDYASSKWCLNELVKILEGKKDQGQIVIPVFYEVDPSHVRNQTGSYGQAFEKHEQDLRHNKDKLQQWRNALTEAANLSGWHSQNYRIESNFIKDIVEDVLKKLYHIHPFEVNEELVGIEKKNEEVESLMKIGSNDIKILAFWGMGGIGKTTLAKYVFAKFSSQFECCCFLENVREEAIRCGLNAVRYKLVSTLLELRPDTPYVETPNSKRRLACKKSLIVLDGVETSDLAENINIVNNCLGPGSRVIVTTRDKQICSQFNECAIYEVNRLNKDDSLQLFCSNAFRKKHAKVGYEELSESAIEYCRGNPLALKVLGANFSTKIKETWESELKKLKKIPNKRIHDVLKLSFNDLDRTQRDIFLDIACFFNPRLANVGFRCRDFLTVLFNACNFFAVSGIEVLLCKALVTVGLHNDEQIQMHDLLLEMGQEIVNQESPKDPGRRSRLWDPEEVYDVLKYNKGTEVVEVIFFDMSEIGNVYLSSDTFKSMINLRYLFITNNNETGIGGNGYIVHLLEGLEWLSDKLRLLRWHAFPLESFPSTFCAERLVQLIICYSKLKKLWDGIQKLDNLTFIRLDYSKDLIEIPDLSRAPNLKHVSLCYCVSLCQLHPSIFTAPKLEFLDLQFCETIESLKTNIHSKSLQTLNLTGCSSLMEFSVTSEEMTSLSLGGTAIHEFPSSMWRNRKLTYLDLSECKKLNFFGKKLSNDQGLGSLVVLDLSSSTQINASNLWFLLDGMPYLNQLCLRECCNLETLPDNIQNNSRLVILRLDECRNLKSVQKLPVSVQQLTAVNCTYLITNSILENMLIRQHNKHEKESNYYYYVAAQVSFLPGAQVPYKFDYRTTKASVFIPHIPKSGLFCFLVCIILSEGLYIEDCRFYISCFIYENKNLVHNFSEDIGTSGTLIADHVLLLSLSSRDFKSIEENSGTRGDHYNLSFEFRHYFDGEKQWSTKGIKGCGVFPVYGLKHNLGLDEIVEDESDELQHQAIGAEAGGSTNENEDDRQGRVE